MSKSSYSQNVKGIYVTPHAVQRYKERVEDISTEQEIIDLLVSIARYGKVIHTKTGAKGNKQYVLKHTGIEILVAEEKSKVVVVTCYGDSLYARWYRKQSYSVRRAFCA